jgi:hypothetical protein
MSIEFFCEAPSRVFNVKYCSGFELPASGAFSSEILEALDNHVRKLLSVQHPYTESTIGDECEHHGLSRFMYGSDIEDRIASLNTLAFPIVIAHWGPGGNEGYFVQVMLSGKNNASDDSSPTLVVNLFSIKCRSAEDASMLTSLLTTSIHPY